MRGRPRARYLWIIDRDHLSGIGEYSYEGMTGPTYRRPGLDAQLRRGEGEKFVMRDDDGELYYSGRIVGEYTGFEPLDDFGTPSAGATTISMWNPVTKSWEEV
jgi:hypothetical protein